LTANLSLRYDKLKLLFCNEWKRLVILVGQLAEGGHVVIVKVIQIFNLHDSRSVDGLDGLLTINGLEKIFGLGLRYRTEGLRDRHLGKRKRRLSKAKRKEGLTEKLPSIYKGELRRK
jgi:hypothetical protein